MKTKITSIAILALTSTLFGQGTFIYDQQSADESTVGGGTVGIQANQPIGQSFTPTLDSVGFIRLYIGVPAGATFYVNLRTNSITGPILGVSDSLFFSADFTGYTNFLFSTPVGLSPGTTYFFQPVVSGSGGVIVAYNTYNYAGGMAFEQGVASPTIDLWFREGVVVVPEPSSLSLLTLGAGALLMRRSGRRRFG